MSDNNQTFMGANFRGNGSPEGVLKATIGATYRDFTGGSIWRKTTGAHLDTGWVNEEGSFITIISADLVATAANSVILISADSGAITITLPLVTTVVGQVFTIKQAGADTTCSITTTDSTIDGSASIAFNETRGCIVIKAFDESYHIISRYIPA